MIYASALREYENGPTTVSENRLTTGNIGIDVAGARHVSWKCRSGRVNESIRNTEICIR